MQICCWSKFLFREMSARYLFPRMQLLFNIVRKARQVVFPKVRRILSVMIKDKMTKDSSVKYLHFYQHLHGFQKQNCLEHHCCYKSNNTTWSYNTLVCCLKREQEPYTYLISWHKKLKYHHICDI